MIKIQYIINKVDFKFIHAHTPNCHKKGIRETQTPKEKHSYSKLIVDFYTLCRIPTPPTPQFCQVFE